MFLNIIQRESLPASVCCHVTFIFLFRKIIMANIRALLKAKRQEVRITHPLASYSASGQLRCVACQSVVKHAAAWEGHVGSKAHRMSVARIREEQRLREEEERDQERHGKRGAVGDSISSVDENGKRRRTDDANEDRTTAFPDHHFSDRLEAFPPPTPPAELGRKDDRPKISRSTTQSVQNAIDLEWENFQQTVLSIPDQQESYVRATISAQPELISHENDGLPSHSTDDLQPSLPSKDEDLRQRREQDDVRIHFLPRP